MAIITSSGAIGDATYPYTGGAIYTPENAVLSESGNARALRLDTGITVTANNSIISVTALGRDGSNGSDGTLEMTDSVLDMDPHTNANQNRTNFIWNNVFITSPGTTYRPWGNWAIGSLGAAGNTQWEDVTFACNVDNDLGFGYNSPYFLFFTADSFYRNVAYWNGSNLGEGAAGAIPQFSSTFTASQTLFGPFGFSINSQEPAEHRTLYRLSPDNSVAQSGHQGWLLNADMRSFYQLDGVTNASGIRAHIMVDNAANVMFVNPLWGNPVGIDQLTFFSSLENRNPRVRQAVATNPVTDDGDVLYTIDDTSITAGFNNATDTAQTTTNVSRAFLIPSAFAGGTTFNTYLSSQLILNPTNGFAFVYQDETIDSANYGNADAATWRANVVDRDHSRAILFPPFDDGVNDNRLEFRQYGWQQGETNDEFGELRKITPPAVATTAAPLTNPDQTLDLEVITSRQTGGYNTVNEDATWADINDVNQTEDRFVAASGFATSALAIAAFVGAPAARTGSDIAVAAKANARTRVTETNITTANSKVNLPYALDGSKLNFSAVDLSFDAIDSGISAAGTLSLVSFEIPALSITSDENVDGIITTTGDITLIGNFTTSTDFTLDSTSGNIVLDGTTNRTYSGLNIGSDVTGWRAGHTFSNITLRDDLEVSLVGFSGTVSIEDVFGTGFTRTGVITVNTDAAVTIEVDSLSNYAAGTGDVTFVLAPGVLTIEVQPINVPSTVAVFTHSAGEYTQVGSTESLDANASFLFTPTETIGDYRVLSIPQSTTNYPVLRDFNFDGVSDTTVTVTQIPIVNEVLSTVNEDGSTNASASVPSAVTTSSSLLQRPLGAETNLGTISSGTALTAEGEYRFSLASHTLSVGDFVTFSNLTGFIGARTFEVTEIDGLAIVVTGIPSPLPTNGTDTASSVGLIDGRLRFNTNGAIGGNSLTNLQTQTHLREILADPNLATVLIANVGDIAHDADATSSTRIDTVIANSKISTVVNSDYVQLSSITTSTISTQQMTGGSSSAEAIDGLPLIDVNSTVAGAVTIVTPLVQFNANPAGITIPEVVVAVNESETGTSIGQIEERTEFLTNGQKVGPYWSPADNTYTGN